MIKNISIKGLKCFDDISLELSELTLFAGVNSIGKSTVIQAILAMIQDTPNPFAGEYINIGKVNELKNKCIGSKEIEICINNKFKKKIVDDKTTIIDGELDDRINIRYISADRIGVKSAYEKNLENPDKIGVNCEYVYQYLAAHERDSWEDSDIVFDDNSKLTFGGQVDYWLDKILGYRISAQEIEGTDFIQVSFFDRYLNNRITPKNVGTGVSYMAEIIIAALSCNPGDTLIIENSEIHLHPSGQADFMELLTFLAENGIQIIMETHSDHIYNGIRKSIHLDYIDKEKVGIYFFEKKENGCSKPVRIMINEDGQVETEQPDGMFDQIKKDLDVILGW